VDRIGTFIKSAIVTAILISLLWIASIGRYEPAEHWLADVYFAKEHRANQINVPKILIVSGSNALFGFDSETLQRLLAKPVVNLAGHAGLSLDFHIEMALVHARADDTVIMPLEFGYYVAEPMLTGWRADNMQSWGARYVHWTPSTLFQYFRYSSFSSLITRILFRQIPRDPEAKVLETVKKNSAGGIPVWRGYSYKSMDNYGDFFVKDGGPSFVGPAYYTTGATTNYALDRLSDLRRKLNARGAKLLLTWPVSIKNPAFDLANTRDRDIVAQLKATLIASGFDVICSASDFQFDRSLFLNTTYHLGAFGSELRTEALAACLQNRPKDDVAAERRYNEKLSRISAR
jgi:hypothetical protein